MSGDLERDKRRLPANRARKKHCRQKEQEDVEAGNRVQALPP